MLRNFNQTIVDLDERPLKLSADDDTEVTLATVSTMALMAATIVQGQPQPADGLKSLQAIDICLRIKASPEAVEVSTEEITVIKDRIQTYFTSPIVVGMAWRMLEG